MKWLVSIAIWRTVVQLDAVRRSAVFGGFAPRFAPRAPFRNSPRYCESVLPDYRSAGPWAQCMTLRDVIGISDRGGGLCATAASS